MSRIEQMAETLATAEIRVIEIDQILNSLDGHLEGLEMERDEWLAGQEREAFENEDDPEFMALEDDIERLDQQIRELRLEREGCQAVITGIQMETRTLLSSWNESAKSAVA